MINPRNLTYAMARILAVAIPVLVLVGIGHKAWEPHIVLRVPTVLP